MSLLDLADEPYILLTTTRRTGALVPTAVWVVRDGDALLVTTGAGSGKVKRIRHTPSVTVQACDRAGTPRDGAAVMRAVASIDESTETRERLEQLLHDKYGAQYLAIKAARVVSGRYAGSVAVRLE